MYRYLDRTLESLDRRDRLLVAAMRYWVRFMTAGRCPRGAVAPAFRNWGIEDALPDFSMAMAALNIDAQAVLRFAPVCFGRVADDEARLLALFASALEDEGQRTRRLSGHLVHPHAVGPLATAVSRVMAAIANAQPGSAAIRPTEG